jgi:hypothetical protein
VNLVLRFVAFAAFAAGAMGCTTSQKVLSGAAVGGVTGFALAGPIGAGLGAAGGAVAVPLAMPRKIAWEQPKRAYAGGGPNTRTALRPPKAKEFDMA